MMDLNETPMRSAVFALAPCKILHILLSGRGVCGNFSFSNKAHTKISLKNTTYQTLTII